MNSGIFTIKPLVSLKLSNPQSLSLALSRPLLLPLSHFAFSQNLSHSISVLARNIYFVCSFLQLFLAIHLSTLTSFTIVSVKHFSNELIFFFLFLFFFFFGYDIKFKISAYEHPQSTSASEIFIFMWHVK